MFKVNNKNTRTYFTPCSIASTVNFEQVINKVMNVILPVIYGLKFSILYFV